MHVSYIEVHPDPPVHAPVLVWLVTNIESGSFVSFQTQPTHVAVGDAVTVGVTVTVCVPVGVVVLVLVATALVVGVGVTVTVAVDVAKPAGVTVGVEVAVCACTDSGGMSEARTTIAAIRIEE